MNGKLFPPFFLLIVIFLTAGCAQHLHVNVLYDRTGGVQEGDPVYLENQEIGAVQNPEVTSTGRIVIPLRIDSGFRDRITERSRFVIQPDPSKARRMSIQVIQVSRGGQPLREGAVIEGSSSLGATLEKGTQGILGWTTLLEETLRVIEEEFNRLSAKEWQEKLENQMEDWARELERSGEEVQRYFLKEVLPRLEKSIRDLRRRLEEQGKEKAIEPLEEKLERLKGVFQ